MTESLEQTIIGLLEPVKDVDWHGKWRVQKALDAARRHVNRPHEGGYTGGPMPENPALPKGGSSVMKRTQTP